LQKGKIRLALGSGATRGLVRIGVLEILQGEGIPIDVIASTSVGALIDALYVQIRDVDEPKSLFYRVS